MAVYSYSRVSTQRQESEGESLGVQERTIAGYAMMHGLSIDQSFVEGGVSGSVALSEREQGSRLLATVKAGDIIITAKLDRMFRSALDALDVLAKLKAKGVALHMIDLNGDVTSNGISKLVFTILAAVAEAERERIRERIATVKQDQKQRGRYLGGIVPFGMAVGADGALVPDQAAQALLAQARQMRTGGATIRSVQAMLAERGHKVSVGGLHGLLQG